MKSLNILIITTLITLSLQIHEGELYDAGRSSLINLNPKNFNTQITNNRNKDVISFIHFYSPDDGKSNQLKEVFYEIDKEYGGMFKLAGLNCKLYHDLCSKQNVIEYPSYMLYPPLPAPVMKYEGKIEAKSIIHYLGKFIDNKCIELNNNNFDDFITSKSNIPKILLFMNKKNVPLIFKSLSSFFSKTLEFGIVRSEMSGITSKYKVTKFPRIMAIGNDKKTTFYEGEMKFKPIFDFCNIYSETFHIVGEDRTPNDEPMKPWMKEKFPEYTKESANEICFNVDKAICVVLVNKEKPNSNLENLFLEIQNWLNPKINRGTKYKFGWINSNSQDGIIKGMGLEKGCGPTLVLINRGARKRYHVYNGELTEDGIQKLFDSLASGDVRFKAFSGNKIPDLEN